MYYNPQMLIPSPPFTTLLFFNPSPLPPSSSAYPPSTVAAAAPPSAVSHLRRSQVEKEPGMEALRSRLWAETASSPQQQQQHNQEAVVLEKGGLLGEGFSVDELLNLGEFGENEKEKEEEAKEEDMVAGDQEVDQMETEEDCCNPTSSSPPSSSALSYEGSQPLSEISLPAHDAEELEWVSLIMDDYLSEFPSVAPLLPQAPKHENRQQPHGAAVATTHVSSIPCATVCAVSTEAPVPPKAKRSKRSRTMAVGWSTSLPFADFSSTASASASSCSSSSSSSLSPFLIYDQSSATGDQSYLLYESHPSLPPPPPSMKTRVPKKRGRKPKQPPAAAGSSGPAALHGDRRCSHCGAQKTPQWRAGPLGAKTLCNACGVRYKSGRLLPEYRPACSPTYVDSIHSSSHRKVLELRRQKEAELLHSVGPPPVPTC